MASTDRMTPAERARNMRAARRERLRNLVDPTRALPEVERERLVDELQRKQLTEIGRLGGATTAQAIAEGKAIVAERDAIAAELDNLAARWRAIGATA